MFAKIGARGSLADERAARKADVLRKRRNAYRLVDARDHNQCRCCGRPVYVNDSLIDKREHHHINGRGREDSETTKNICLVCAACHRLLTEGLFLRISGDADGELLIERRCGDEWFKDGEDWT